MSQKVVVAKSSNESVFKIPKGVDLEDKTQVEWWCVRYNTLHIKLVGSEEASEIAPSYESEDDHKYPEEIIQNRSDCDYEDFLSDSEAEEEESNEEESEVKDDREPRRVNICRTNAMRRTLRKLC